MAKSSEPMPTNVTLSVLKDWKGIAILTYCHLAKRLIRTIANL